MRHADADVVIIGLGAIGSAAAYRLAKRGRRVIGVERFELGHDRGASHGRSRIVRRSYHTPAYVSLAGRAYDAWQEVERELGSSLLVPTGGLDLFPRGAAIDMDEYVRAMTANGVAFEVLDAGAVCRRWPQWHLDPRSVALFQPDAAMMSASDATSAHQRLAVAHGATLRDHTEVISLRDVDGEIVVGLDGGEVLTSGTAIVCADAWTNEVLTGIDIELPLTVTQEQVTYFTAADLNAFAPGRFPVWIWMDDPSFYGFPTDGGPGVKAAEDCGGPEVTPDTRTFAPAPANLRRLSAFVSEHLPALGPPTQTTTCLYTLTPDRDFVVDRVPDHPNVVVALGAAHAFKFSALLGRVLADLVVTGTTGVDLEPFRIDRPVLRSPHRSAQEYRQHWVV